MEGAKLVGCRCEAARDHLCYQLAKLPPKETKTEENRAEQWREDLRPGDVVLANVSDPFTHLSSCLSNKYLLRIYQELSSSLVSVISK